MRAPLGSECQLFAFLARIALTRGLFAMFKLFPVSMLLASDSLFL